MLRGERMVISLDMHSEGEPVRVVVGGLGPVPGESMADKVSYFKEHLDDVRSALVLPPRGSREHLGSIVTPPCSPEGHLGVIFIDATGYLAMCGDATIATASAAVDAGLVVASDGEVLINLDTPAGLVRAKVTVNHGEADRVRFTNVPAFVLHEDVTLPVEGLGQVGLDIAFGGNFCALVSAPSLNLRVGVDQVKALKEAGQAIKEAVNRSCPVSHPDIPTAHRTELVMFYEMLDPAHYRNAVIFGDRQLVLSPCGTGSSALLALLTHSRRLPRGQVLRSESVLGTSYYLTADGSASVGGRPAIIPTVEGRAYVTGIYQLVLAPGDPLRNGFLVG